MRQQEIYIVPTLELQTPLKRINLWPNLMCSSIEK